MGGHRDAPSTRSSLGELHLVANAAVECLKQRCLSELQIAQNADQATLEGGSLRCSVLLLSPLLVCCSTFFLCHSTLLLCHNRLLLDTYVHRRADTHPHLRTAAALHLHTATHLRLHTDTYLPLRQSTCDVTPPLRNDATTLPHRADSHPYLRTADASAANVPLRTNSHLHLHTHNHLPLHTDTHLHFIAAATPPLHTDANLLRQRTASCVFM
mmetsp:Transcript_32407/g.71300  ORF Transcript_32407/g.71300 Transcript_32407/m.71300 type:complete len:213 (-) Transcript_32407:703-1341(-)